MVAPPSTGGQPAHSPIPTKSAPLTRPNGPVPNPAPPTIPYSARRAPPLDMNTVERRGHPSSRDPPTRNRPHGLMEAPTFRPTEEEFRDPMEYIKSISEKARKFGICKIIPPDSWNPDFAIDLERFHFRTRRQELNTVEGSSRANLTYLDNLARFHKQYGTNLNRFPSVDKRPLDLYKLKKAVEVRGGFDKVCKDKKWAEIGRDLGYSGKIMSSLSTSLKNSYQRWLHPYEEYLRTAKPGVQQQIEHENGGPYQTSPAYSPNNSGSFLQQNIPTAPSTQAPAMQASAALNASLEHRETTSQPSPLPAVEVKSPTPLQPLPTSGFTAVNTGGFSAVNAPSGFVAVNNQPQPVVKREDDGTRTTPTANGQFHAVPFTQQQDGGHGSPAGPVITNGNSIHSNPLKRTMSHDSLHGESGSDGANGDDDSGSGRRSKRIKKDVAPIIPGSHMNAMRPSTPRMRVKPNGRRFGERCEQCGKAEDRENIVVCDSCDLGYHRNCLDPPMPSLPEYDWHCPKCLVGTGDYGFEEGGIYPLKVFQEKANNFKEHYFSSRMPYDPITNNRKVPTEDDIEREFWRLVESLEETVEVEYGADIHSTTHGSGFPTIEKNPLDPYSKDPWNLNVLPFHEESLFRHIKTDISGMTVPWLYVGMCFSTFCWHNEDHYTYSANYQHFGATKTWYGIPGKDAQAFEEAMRNEVPELFETQPDLLFQLVTLLPPGKLQKAGVEVYALDQRAGQFVITFPQAYHAGFNHGFNFNEAVNFAPADWEPFGEIGVQRLQEFRRQPCFSHDELLLTAAAVDSTIKTATWLAPALERMRDRELRLRAEFVKRHKELSPHEPCQLQHLVSSEEEWDYECNVNLLVKDAELPEEEYQCHHCKAYCFLSQFRCRESGKISCLLHAASVECCSPDNMQRSFGRTHTLCYRYSDEELNSRVQKVVDKAAVPAAWESKLESLLQDEARPALKSMHTLLAEGEKIPHPLKGLDSLTEFVKRCDQWVDEANLYLTRKQQNRRKNEKAWRRQSTKGLKIEEKDTEPQLTIDRMTALIKEGDDLGFQCAQLENLNEKLVDVNGWRSQAKSVLHSHISTAEEIEGLLETGRGFLAAMPELTDLETLYHEQKWAEDARSARAEMHARSQSQSLGQCKAILERANALRIPPGHPEVTFFNEMVRDGNLWEDKAKEVMAAEVVHYPQLESLRTRVQDNTFPVNPETLAQMDAILTKNREAHKQIVTLYERSQDQDFRKRPLYTDIRDVMKTLEDLNSKPQGTIDLERELRKHEDWMRKGKKLFGKANAPLHILEVHMKFVEEKNNACFDLNDTFRAPVEPASREASPTEDLGKNTLGEDEKPVFCICRQPENGMMIMCEICHEWYHSRCLKIARGKMKEYEIFTCPICDWRVKIPRDAARPKLEDLQYWAEEMPNLPFQPEEEDILNRILEKAQAFRDFLQQFTNGNQICQTSEEMPTILFYLRKLEGAEVLLAFETNSFRQQLHKWQPIAPEPPPIIEQSSSTRKPRPTKQQKIMKEMGVEKIEDLPPHLRTKQSIKRKNTDPSINGNTPRPPTLQPAQMQRDGSGPHGRSDTPSSVPRQASTGNAPGNGHYNGNHLPMSMAQSPTFSQGFPASGPPSYPASTPSPMFSPAHSLPTNGLRDPMMASRFPGGPSAGPSPHDPSFPLFSPGFVMGIDADDDIRTGLANSNGAATTSEPNEISSPHANNVDEMFLQMTNQDPDTQHDPPIALENEPSQASEALEMIRSASNDSGPSHERDGDEGAIDPEESGFDEFFGDGDAQS